MSRHCLQELLGKHSLHNGEKGLNENSHVVKITLLDASPDARPIPNDNRECIEQDYTDSAVIVHNAEDGKDESIALKRAMVYLESFPPYVFVGMIYSYSEVATGVL